MASLERFTPYLEFKDLEKKLIITILLIKFKNNISEHAQKL